MLTIAAIVLAAGEGSRMGQPKALLEFDDRRGLDLALKAVSLPEIDETVVVLGASADEVKNSVHLDDVVVVVNDNWQEGMITSLQAGLRAITLSYDYVVMHLVDHCLVPPSVVQALLLRAYAAKPKLILPYVGGRTGHPIVFDRSMADEILALPANVGADTVIRQHKTEAELVEVESDTIFFDLDTPEDYKKAKEIFNKP